LQHDPVEQGAATSSTVVAPTQPSIFESGIPLDLIDDPMLVNERMKEFNDSFQDLFRFSTVSALNTPYLLLLSSIASQTSSQCQTDHGQLIPHQVEQIASRGDQIPAVADQGARDRSTSSRKRYGKV
jgi:hypothetical protein